MASKIIAIKKKKNFRYDQSLIDHDLFFFYFLSIFGLKFLPEILHGGTEERKMVDMYVRQESSGWEVLSPGADPYHHFVGIFKKLYLQIQKKCLQSISRGRFFRQGSYFCNSLCIWGQFSENLQTYVHKSHIFLNNKVEHKVYHLLKQRKPSIPSPLWVWSQVPQFS